MKYYSCNDKTKAMTKDNAQIQIILERQKNQ